MEHYSPPQLSHPHSTHLWGIQPELRNSQENTFTNKMSFCSSLPPLLPPSSLVSVAKCSQNVRAPLLPSNVSCPVAIEKVARIHDSRIHEPKNIASSTSISKIKAPSVTKA